MVTLKRHNIAWGISTFFTLSTLACIVGLALYIPRYGVHPLEPITTVAFVYIVAMAIAGGYHRLFSHRAYKAHPILKIIWLIIGSAGLQQSAIKWSADHRLHHRFVDTDRDPYSFKKGFFWAHIGWILTKDPQTREELLTQVPDLVKDKYVMWQYRYWALIGAVLSIGIPLGIGFLIGRPLGMFLWAGLLRVVLTHQTTFTINSLAHWRGKQPYSNKNSSKDVWWLAPFLVGESYHNYHHTFQWDYRNGIRWYHWDPVKWFLWPLSYTPLVHHLRRTPVHLVLKARMEIDLYRLQNQWKRKPPQDLWLPIQSRLLKIRQGLLEAGQQLASAKENYRQFKQDVSERSRQSLEQAKRLLKEKEQTFHELKSQWKDLVHWAREGSWIAVPA